MGDRTHFLIRTVLTYSPSGVAQRVKSVTARDVLARAPEVKRNLLGRRVLGRKGYFHKHGRAAWQREGDRSLREGPGTIMRCTRGKWISGCYDFKYLAAASAVDEVESLLRGFFIRRIDSTTLTD